MATINPEATPVSKWPTIWKYSLIIAACSFAYTLLLYITGLVTSTGVSLISIVIFVVLLVMAMRKYRSLNSGYMTFGTATIIGIVISIASSVISSALNAFYLAVIDDSILSVLNEQTLQALQQSPGMNAEMLDMMSGFYTNFLFTPGGMFVSGIVSGVIGGVIISLILAAILKKDPPITG